MVSTPDKPILGRLEKIDVRTYWEREDIDFTPWLAEPENSALLGNQNQSHGLIETHKILLPKATVYKIRVQDAEKVVEQELSVVTE